MDQEALKELIADYRYGQFNILTNGMTISYNQWSKTALCNPHYHLDTSRKEGTCGELANTAYREITQHFPDLHVLRSTGFSQTHFRIGLIHDFLLVSENELVKPNREIPANWIRRRLNQHSIVVDPSFHYIAPYKGSGYTAGLINSPGFPRQYSKALLLRPDLGIHLCQTKQGEMIILGLYAHEDDILRIGIQQKDGTIKGYPLSSKELDERLSDDKTAMQFIEFLRGLKPVFTTEELRETIDTIIR